MLYAKALRSPYADAKIKSMDTSKAEAYRGVRGILRYDDPEVTATGHAEILNSEAWHEGGPCGCIIAAETLQIAEEAVKLVEVEWEELPFYLDPEKALASDASVLYPEIFEDNQYTTYLSKVVPNTLARKNPDLDAGFAEADEIIEDRVEYKKMYHAGSEPRCYIFQWRGDELHDWCHSQTPGTEGPMAQGDRLLIPRILNMPASKMIIHPTFQGGTFGGKISLEHICVGVAVLAKKLSGAPVSFLQSRSDEQGREDAGMICNFKVGVKKDGTITALKIDPVIIEVGDSGVEGEGFIWCIVNGARPQDMLLEVLKCPNIDTVNKYALTSKACSTSFRCEKNQTAFLLGKLINIIATKLDIDPVQVALKNGNCATNSMDEVIAAGKEAFGWDEKWHLPGTKKLANGKMHGVGFTFAHMWHAGGGTYNGSMGASIDFDGSVQLYAQLVDVGVSPHTTYIMVAAEELGVTIDKIHFALNDSTSSYTLKSPGGSYGCACNVPLVQMVSKALKAKILNMVAEYFGVTAEELDIKDNSVYVIADPTKTETIATLFGKKGYAKFPLTTGIDATVSPGKQEVPYRCFQAHFCEVEVDTETGKVDVTNVVNVNDFGQMIRPESCEGQMYGGYLMAWGRNLTEENIYDPATGCRLNDNLCDYKYSLMKDSVFPNILPMEIAKDVGVYGNVGSGEPTATVTDSFINSAICNAIGININQNPVLPGDILKALGKA
jgi:xanthine dehydrogenase molybdenum-binding subunit